MLGGPSPDTGTSPKTFLNSEDRSVPCCSLLGYVGLVAPPSEGENSKGCMILYVGISLHEYSRLKLKFRLEIFIQFELLR